jgi:hypothetical protein
MALPPAHLSAQERVQIYRSVLGAPGGADGEVKPNREFADLWLRFVAGVAQSGRQGPQALKTSAFAAARELATQAGPLVDSAAARDQWNVIDKVDALELGGAVNSARHRTMAEAGGAILEWLARHGGVGDAGGVDDGVLDAVEQWLAVAGTRDGDVQALSQPEASARVAAWSKSLHQALGLREDTGARMTDRTPKTTALFSGPPGTGKTLAAFWLAASLNRDALRIDLGQVASKYIGETEKNLDAVFKRAERSDAVLLFDEADALFGKRTDVRDSHDRYANLEVNSLLQRIERFAGMTILATNAEPKLDPDVLKRMKAIVVFPLPPRP